MNCDWVKENVVLYIYDELADDARHTFEHHTQHCLACRQELESALELASGSGRALVLLDPTVLEHWAAPNRLAKYAPGYTCIRCLEIPPARRSHRRC